MRGVRGNQYELNPSKFDRFRDSFAFFGKTDIRFAFLQNHKMNNDYLSFSLFNRNILKKIYNKYFLEGLLVN